jgi:large subunit ribosomal protein L27
VDFPLRLLYLLSAQHLIGDFVVAHKKGQGSTKNGRDSNPQFRGIKLYGGQVAKSGAIIVRQCGTRWKPGYLVHLGKDHTLMALAAGTVRFRGSHVDIIPSDLNVPAYAAVGSDRG